MDLISEYQLERIEIERLEQMIRLFLSKRGVRTTLISMEKIIETKLYEQDSEAYHVDRAVQNDDAHHETCLSDGLDIWMHDEIEHVGGECSRLYDLLHVGCGHLFQWAASIDSGLAFYGDQAWKMASTLYLKAPEADIQRVWAYEREAAQIAVGNLKHILDSSSQSQSFRENVARMFNDYATTDLEYITAYYRTGKVTSIFENWCKNSPTIPPIITNFPIKPVRRSNRCVALLSRRD